MCWLCLALAQGKYTMLRCLTAGTSTRLVYSTNQRLLFRGARNIAMWPSGKQFRDELETRTSSTFAPSKSNKVVSTGCGHAQDMQSCRPVHMRLKIVGSPTITANGGIADHDTSLVAPKPGVATTRFSFFMAVCTAGCRAKVACREECYLAVVCRMPRTAPSRRKNRA
jgi:hypothetical protein